MEERIIQFIAALRSAGVRVSLAESADAFLAVDQLGIKEGDDFRWCLQATLVKEARNIPIFEELFPQYFGNAASAPMMNLSDDLTVEEADMLARALRQFTDQIRQMLMRLLRGEGLSSNELERLAKFVGLTQTDNLRYREWMVRRMKKAMHFRQVREALQELADLLSQMGMNDQRMEQMRQLILGNLQVQEDQLSKFAGQRFAENMSHTTPDNAMEGLLNQPFECLTEKDMERLHKEVRRLAAALRTRVALRQKRAKNGQLDAKATIRANLKHGKVPIQINTGSEP